MSYVSLDDELFRTSLKGFVFSGDFPGAAIAPPVVTGGIWLSFGVVVRFVILDRKESHYVPFS